MKEIKFRQAIFLNEKFSYWHYWGFIKDGCFDAPIMGNENGGESYQYAGRKDKNGKEVYEGDILTIWIEETKQDKNYVVKDLRELFFETEREDNYLRISGVEIVGNAYENPELLSSALTV